MLKRYEQIIEDYKIWHTSLYNRTVECRPSGKHCILASLDDETKIEFNSLDKTIRDVTRLYNHEFNETLDEVAWRKEFGHKLHRIITDKGMTQEKLSEVTGISRQMLSRYVRGTSTPSGYILSRIVETLGCDIRELTKFGYIDE
jgi:predicted XRE-type DNA-binding protein